MSAPPCKVGGHWRLQNDQKTNVGNLCKMYENKDFDYDGLFFGGPFPTFSLRFGELFWFSQSIVGMCQHSQPNTLNANISLYFALQRKKS